VTQSVYRRATVWAASVIFIINQEIVFYSTESMRALGSAQVPIHWALRALSLKVKRLKREAAEVEVEVELYLHFSHMFSCYSA
jgi:hypothetical protein